MGRVPQPRFDDDPAYGFIDKPEGYGWDYVDHRNISGVCIHRMEGTLLGTNSYFRDPGGDGYNSLTDFGIGGFPERNNGYDGVVFQWNTLNGHRSPYANGHGPNVDTFDPGVTEGKAFEWYEKRSGKVNSDLVSIELSGLPNDPITEKQFQSLCWLIAWVYDAWCGVSYTDFPVNPAVGMDTVFAHYEFSEKDCPWSNVLNLRPRYLARAKEILKNYQLGRYRGATPDPGLTMNDDPGGVDDTPAPGDRRFLINQRVKTMQPDVRLRASAGSGSNVPILATLASGTGMCVTGRPAAKPDGLWYPVLVTGGSPKSGWIRGDLLQIVQNPGYNCGTLETIFVPGDVVKLNSRRSLWSSTGTSDPGTPLLGSMTQFDPFIHACRGIPEQPKSVARQKGAVRLDEVNAYIDEMYRLCAHPDVGFDASLIIAQSSHETYFWTDELADYWKNNLNPAGIGITFDGQESFTWNSGTDAARGHLVHVYGYVRGNIPSRNILFQYKHLDPRWDALVASGNLGTAANLNDLGGGNWAEDPDYGPEIVANHGNVLFRDAIDPVGTPAPKTRVVTLKQGTKLCILEGPLADGSNKFDWYKVKYRHYIGYVASKYCQAYKSGACTVVSPSGDFEVGDRIEATTELNYRSNPGLAPTLILGTLPVGSQFCLLEGPTFTGAVDDPYAWYRMQYGWVAGEAEFCRLVDKSSCTGTPSAGKWAIGDSIWVSDPDVNLRAGHSTSAPVLMQLGAGVEVCVLDGPKFGENVEWYYVKYGTIEGWVAGAYFSLGQVGRCNITLDSGRFRYGDVIQVTDTDGLRIRESASVTSPAIGAFNYGTILTVLSGAVYSDDGIEWYRVTDHASTGWVAGQYCDPYVTAGSLFAGADFSGRALRLTGAGVNAGEVLRAHQTVDVLASPVSTAEVVGLVYAPQEAIVTGAHVIDRVHGVTFLPVATRLWDGWVDASKIGKAASPTNYLPNPGVDSDLSGIGPLVSTTVTRESKDGDYAAKCVADGAEYDQGLRFYGDGLAMTGQWIFAATCEAVGLGVLDNVKLRIMYSDGSASTYSSPAPSITLDPDRWQRVSIPRVASMAGKTVSRVELWIRRHAKTAQTFWVDNAIVTTLN